MSALLSEILDPRHVILELREATAAEAILEIVEQLRNNGQVKDYFKLADAVMEREGRTSTNTGEGVAFPMRALLWSIALSSVLAVPTLVFDSATRKNWST